MLKAFGDFMALVLMILIMAYAINHTEIEKHGLKPYFDKSKVWVHDIWYGR